VDAFRLLCSFTHTNNNSNNNNRGGCLILSLLTNIMADASLSVDKEVINVDDDADNSGSYDEWQSLFHVSKEAVEDVISSRKNEGGKKKENLALLEFIATKGNGAFTEGNPLNQEDRVFFAQLARTAQLKL
jgi:oligoribonuclease (3'-5' exoribonuclease)